MDEPTREIEPLKNREIGMRMAPPKTRLSSLNSVRVHLNWVITELEAGRLEPKISNALTISLNAMASIIKSMDAADEVKERLAKLENMPEDILSEAEDGGGNGDENEGK